VCWRIIRSQLNSTSPSRWTLTGKITKIEWTNPHAFLFIDVADKQTGAVTNWEIEMGSPNGLTRLGWTRTLLKPATRSPLTAVSDETRRTWPTPDLS
jgi:hypothetical protein